MKKYLGALRHLLDLSASAAPLEPSPESHLLCLMRKLFAISLFILSGLFAPHALAEPVLVIDNGRLMGAKEVQLGLLGTFDVEFKDGSCISLYYGCTVDTVPFHSVLDAKAAANALLNGVVIGFYDGYPQFTNGCFYEYLCNILTPYITYAGYRLPPEKYGTVATQNAAYNPYDEVTTLSFNKDYITTYSNYYDKDRVVYAVWSKSITLNEVPEPPSLAIFVLLGIVLRRHQRRRTTTQ